MNIGELRNRLQEKERELLADIARTEAEARNSRVADVENHTDGIVSSESKEGLFQQTSADWNVFTEVRDALQRVKDGTYGTCVDCGRHIGDDRLDSVPWTPYCLDDQNRHDREYAAQ